MVQEPHVRFDDCRSATPSAFVLSGLREVVETRDVDAVDRALSTVADRVRGGLWAGGFISYEAAPAFDPGFVVRDPDPGSPFAALPLLWFGLFEGREDVEPLEAEPTRAPAYRLTPWSPSIDRVHYIAAVERIRELIAEGRTYQVNLSFRLRAALEGDGGALYRDLCLAQRSATCASISTGRFRILSASPELFFRVDGDVVTGRPMKGTAPRGRWVEEDRDLVESLLTSEKERAENAMIVDLIRNDVGRVAVPGSVEVPRLFEPERYETVWQLTSTVTAGLPRATGPVDVLRALFPCGSVTGAPKASAMRTIADLEDSPRGVYTGALGFLAPPGAPGPRARFSVAIRTVVVDAPTGNAEYGVGGGITWDSSPEGEYEECRAKARVLYARRERFDLLETLRFEPDEGLLFVDRHLERLAGSAEYFGFVIDEGAVRKELDAAVEFARQALRIRLLLSRDGGVRVETAPAPAPLGRPVRLAVHPEPVDPADPLRFHKTTLRAPYEQAASAHPGADDVVLVNTRGEAVETTVANLAARIAGRWWTPPLAAGCLPGVYRGALLADGTLTERTLTVEDLSRAEALAVVSSVRLWRPATLRR